MSNFILASELPRRENCHVLAVDVVPFWENLCQVGYLREGGDPEMLPKNNAKSCGGQTV